MKTAVIYARYSSDKQTEQSIEGQLYDCYNYAKQHGINVVREYIDRAMTGKNDDRPAFREMIADSSLKQWDYVLVWKLDRFARNTMDSAVNRQALRRNGVRLLSVMESFGENASGEMMEHIIEAINEYYSADLREKTIRGMRQSALKAQSTGHIPLGYKSVDKKLVIDEDTRFIPETVFRMYAAGEKLTDIADLLNEKGYRTRTGKKFTVNSFYSMLNNEKYTGVYKYDDIRIEGGIPKLIDEKDFEKVRERLKINRKRAAKNAARADYILSGKLFCGYCGEPMSGLSGTARNGDKHYYYRCNGVQKKSGCAKRNEKKEFIETEVCRAAWEAFRALDKQEFAEEVHKLYIAEISSSTPIEQIEKKLAEVSKQAENVVNAIANTGGNQMLYDKVKVLEAQKEQIESELRVVRAVINNVPSTEQIMKMVDDILEMSPDTHEGRKTIVDMMVSKIYLFDDKIVVTFKAPDGSSKDIPLSEIKNAPEADCILSASGTLSLRCLTFLQRKTNSRKLRQRTVTPR
ncbi:MAG: recombinase family protein [Prevotella sp.]|nr:recombinase family protein [Prevotella sp.]